jgi:hypothetical protein
MVAVRRMSVGIYGDRSQGQAVPKRKPPPARHSVNECFCAASTRRFVAACYSAMQLAIPQVTHVRRGAISTCVEIGEDEWLHARAPYSDITARVAYAMP